VGRIDDDDLGEEGAQYGVIFAFQVLPTIIFIAALFAILYYLGVMQIRGAALRLRHAPRDEGERRRVAERGRQHLHGPDRSAADHPPVPRQDDAVRADDGHDLRHGAHLRRHHGRVHRVFGIEARHLLTAVIMTAPGTLMMAKMFVPETGQPETHGHGQARGREAPT
jgi:CNT family concentrative nucleoside transporter